MYSLIESECTLLWWFSEAVVGEAVVGEAVVGEAVVDEAVIGASLMIFNSCFQTTTKHQLLLHSS